MLKTNPSGAGGASAAIRAISRFQRARAHAVGAQPIDGAIARHTHQPLQRRTELRLVTIVQLGQRLRRCGKTPHRERQHDENVRNSSALLLSFFGYSATRFRRRAVDMAPSPQMED
jgi:hypothetical protein